MRLPMFLSDHLNGTNRQLMRGVRGRPVIGMVGADLEQPLLFGQRSFGNLVDHIMAPRCPDLHGKMTAMKLRSSGRIEADQYEASGIFSLSRYSEMNLS